MRPTPFSRPAGQLAANRFSTTATRSTAATAPIAHQLNINPNAPPPDAGTGLTVTASAPLWMWGAGGLVAAFILWKALK